MTCRNCGAGLEAGRIDASLGVVTCSHCGSLHDIPRDSSMADASSAAARSASHKHEREAVELPERFTVKRSDGGIEVTWKAGGAMQGVVLLFMAGGIGYMAVMSGFLLLLAGSAALVYLAAVRVFNTHRVRVDSARLQVSQGPVPTRGGVDIAASDIEQLYATEHESRSETGSDGDRRVQIRKHYRLLARTRSKKRISLLRGLADPHQALWLEQEIERLLAIGDKRVAGEHRY